MEYFHSTEGSPYITPTNQRATVDSHQKSVLWCAAIVQSKEGKPIKHAADTGLHYHNTKVAYPWGHSAHSALDLRTIKAAHHPTAPLRSAN